MGKLLQKIVHGIVPSWLTRVKSSAPKMLLPSASNRSRDCDPPAAPATSAQSSIWSCSVDSAAPPSMQHTTTNMQLKDDHHPHQFKDNNDHHHLHHADMNDYCSRHMYSPATQIYAPNQQADEGIQDENHHPQNCYHRHHVERPNCGDHVLLGSENRRIPCIQCMQEDDNSYHHQKDYGGYHEQPNAKHKRSNVGSKREIGCAQEEKKHNHKDYAGNEAHNGYDVERKNHRPRDLAGFKRKSTYSEEDKDEEEKRGGRQRGGDSSMRGWGWKRRKREEGLMSCELPESICGVVGNAKAVVKYSQEPQVALWESMVEMIVGNGLRELGSLEFLLFCYLSLNEPHLHSIIQSSFLQVLKELEITF